MRARGFDGRIGEFERLVSLIRDVEDYMVGLR